MATDDIAYSRLYNQKIAATRFKKPHEVVAWLGAMQGQDYAGVKWSIGLRLKDSTDAAIEKAIGHRTIVRTWALRGTLHMLAAKDIHWLMALIGPRVVATSYSFYKKLGFEEKVFARSNALIVKSLQGNRQLTRDELSGILSAKGFNTKGQGSYYMLHRAALDRLICLGERRGKEFTYTLLEDWIPAAGILDREEALAKFTRQYFISHGPATLKDFVWWSGFTATEAREGLELVKSKLAQDTVDGVTYWSKEGITSLKNRSSALFMIPGFDEYILGYTDRSAVLDKVHIKQVAGYGNGMMSPTILVNGRVAGTWNRTFKKDTVHFEVKPFAPFTKAQYKDIADEAQRFAAFMGMKAILP